MICIYKAITASTILMSRENQTWPAYVQPLLAPSLHAASPSQTAAVSDLFSMPLTPRHLCSRQNPRASPNAQSLGHRKMQK